jgi:hypothetical protein
MGQPSMLRTVGRLIWVPIAFLLSALIALFVIVSLGQERITLALRGRGPNEATIDAAFDLFGLALQLLSVYTLVPAILLIVIGEVARIRTALYYVIGGGLTLAVVPLLAGLNQPASALDVSAVVWQVLATAGFAGGFVYWLLAGRKA